VNSRICPARQGPRGPAGATSEPLDVTGASPGTGVDGGGSTTMVVGGEVVSHPPDPAGERQVGDAVLVLPQP